MTKNKILALLLVLGNALTACSTTKAPVRHRMVDPEYEAWRKYGVADEWWLRSRCVVTPAYSYEHGETVPHRQCFPQPYLKVAVADDRPQASDKPASLATLEAYECKKVMEAFQTGAAPLSVPAQKKWCITDEQGQLDCRCPEAGKEDTSL